MSTPVFFLCVGAVLWAVGLHGMMTVRHILRRVIAINIMTSGAFLVLVALAARSAEADPVLQALVLTGLVISVSATAFALHLGTAAFSRDNRESGPR